MAHDRAAQVKINPRKHIHHIPVIRWNSRKRERATVFGDIVFFVIYGECTDVHMSVIKTGAFTFEVAVVKAGDTITVTYKIREGNKERLQNFQGVVLQRVGGSPTETFTVRKISSGIGVERIFPIASPFIDAIKVNKKGVVRRARIFYLRGLTGKKARIKEKRV